MNKKKIILSATLACLVFLGLAAGLVSKLKDEQAHLTIQPIKTGPKTKPVSGLALKPGMTIQTWDESPSYITMRLEAGIRKDSGVYTLVNMSDRQPCNVNVEGRAYEEYAPYSPFDSLATAATFCLNQAYLSNLEISTPHGTWKDQKGDILDMENSLKKIAFTYNGKQYQYMAASMEPCTSATKCSSGVKVAPIDGNPLIMYPYIEDVQETIAYYEKEKA